MFQKLTDLKFKRSALQAVGFYIIYLALIIVISMVMGMIIGVAVTDKDAVYEIGTRAGMTVAIICCLGLSFTILKKKGLLSNYPMIVVAVLSGVLAFIGGGILGLIPVAYLSTRK